MKRREMLKNLGGGTAALLAGKDLIIQGEDMEALRGRVNTHSQPSALKITDLRAVNIHNRWIIRIDTNQGISGYGEVRDGSSPTYTLMLKSRILGENPCHVDKLFRKLKQFGNHARQAGGVVSIEMACWDLAGRI